jgi:hypothetical protein
VSQSKAQHFIRYLIYVFIASLSLSRYADIELDVAAFVCLCAPIPNFVMNVSHAAAYSSSRRLHSLQFIFRNWVSRAIPQFGWVYVFILPRRRRVAKKKNVHVGQSGRRSPPISLQPLDFDSAVEGLLRAKPSVKKKPAPKKATGKRKK